MRIPRIYHHGHVEVDKEYSLSTSASHHLTKVLRLSENHPLILFNGDGNNYCAKILALGKSVTVLITSIEKNTTESPIRIHLGQVISKGDKMDYTVQKAVELGVHVITPLLSEHCDVKLNKERLLKKQEHWQNIIINACQQCGRSFVPTCHDALKLSRWFDEVDTDLKIMLEPTGSLLLSQLPKQDIQSIAILIGSEGGFSTAEVAEAKNHGFVTIQLSTRILRTETAGVAALALMQHLYGDFC